MFSACSDTINGRYTTTARIELGKYMDAIPVCAWNIEEDLRDITYISVIDVDINVDVQFLHYVNHQI